MLGALIPLSCNNYIIVENVANTHLPDNIGGKKSLLSELSIISCSSQMVALISKPNNGLPSEELIQVQCPFVVRADKNSKPSREGGLIGKATGKKGPGQRKNQKR